jgi:hypothetical protein
MNRLLQVKDMLLSSGNINNAKNVQLFSAIFIGFESPG